MRRTAAVLVLIAATGVAGCGGNRADHNAGLAAGGPATDTADIAVISPEFTEGGRLPDRYTCHGAGLAPPLRWSGVPAATGAVAVVVTDPDAPQGTYTHWVLFDLPPRLPGLTSVALPPQARQARNSAGTTGYVPPCPPSGTHHYHFTVIALRERIALPDDAPLDRAMRQIQAGALAHGTLVATVTHP